MFSEEGKEFTECHFLTPPQPIKRFIYRCDRKFHVDHILPLYEDGQKWGLILVTGSNTDFYMVQGTKVTRVTNQSAHINKNQKKGGQSAARIGRIRDELIHNYITLIQEQIVESFLEPETKESKVFGIILAGPGEKKNLVYQRMDSKLREICYLKTTPEKEILKTVLEDSKEFMEHSEKLENNKSLKEFFGFLDEQTYKGTAERAIYGKKEVLKALQKGKLEKLWVHESLVEKKPADFKTLEGWAKDVNCEVIKVFDLGNESYRLMNDFGGLVGTTWY